MVCFSPFLSVGRALRTGAGAPYFTIGAELHPCSRRPREGNPLAKLFGLPATQPPGSVGGSPGPGALDWICTHGQEPDPDASHRHRFPYRATADRPRRSAGNALRVASSEARVHSPLA